MSLHTWCRQGPRKPSSCTTFTLNSHWGRAATGQKKKKKVLHLCTQGHFSSIQLFATLWTVACQASISGEFSRQEYWSILVNTGCHTLLEHYVSFWPGMLQSMGLQRVGHEQQQQWAQPSLHMCEIWLQQSLCPLR